MRLSIVGAALLAPAAFAQSSSSTSTSAAASSTGNSSYIQGVLQALTAANLTTLVSVAESVYNTSAGMQLFSMLGMGNYTVFAPTNEAFSMSNMSAADMNNTEYLAEVLAYHVLNNTWTMNNTATFPNHTIARTMLNGGNFTLPGNYSAPVVLSLMSSNSSNLTVNEAYMNVTTMGGEMANNLMLYIIDSVLMLPQSIGDVAMKLFPTLAGVIEKSGLLDPLEMATGITVFAPTDSALNAVMSSLGSLNSTELQTVLANHVINGSVAYSTDLMNGNYTSAAGEPFTFMQNSTGMFVMSANSTAMITQSDIILQNGVAYLIDNVLVNTMSNSTAAAAAYSSGMAAASSTDNASPATSSASTSGSTKSAAGAVAPFAWTNTIIGGALAIAGVVLGGGYVLA